MASAPPVMFMPVYEFTEQQNIVIRHLAARMRTVGIALLVFATLVAVSGVMAEARFRMLLWAAALVLGCIGFWSTRAGAELQQMVRTRGADIPHLMNALSEIRKLYDIQYWIVVLAVLFASVTMLLAALGARWVPALW